MKYKTLLIGDHRSVIDDLFNNVEKLECVTSSLHVLDIVRHLKFYEPELLILCLGDDSGKELANIVNQFRRDITGSDVNFVILGDKDVCEDFIQACMIEPDLYLIRPLTNVKIMEKIDEYINDKKREKEKEEEEKRKAEDSKKREDLKPHILVVDDDPNMLEVLKGQLEGEYRVATAINGGLALRFLTKKTTDLILLDYEMPVQSGPQVLTILKNNEATKDIPVVFLTGISDTEKIAKALMLKPQGYLLKPVDSKKLLETVKKVLTESKEHKA